MQLRERRDGGEALRNAMREARLSIPVLATKTAELDGYGVSRSTIGHLVSTGTTQRDRCSKRSAELIARALGLSVDDLFT